MYFISPVFGFVGGKCSFYWVRISAGGVSFKKTSASISKTAPEKAIVTTPLNQSNPSLKQLTVQFGESSQGAGFVLATCAKFAAMTIHQAQQQLTFQLYNLYDNREAANIADWVMEVITGWKKIDRIVNKQVPLLPEKMNLLERYTQELLAHRPVQYVLGEAWFAGMAFFVNEQVLIPRPETEELVEWVVREVQGNPTILDVGTGSGCIAIALKKRLPNARIYACDVSTGALEVAKRNAANLQTDVEFLQLDFLKDPILEVDLIVSNPPYIPFEDKQTMRENVLQYEPHLALFVEDPLIFYKTIAKYNITAYMEIHENLAEQTKALFKYAELKKDMQGKNRMIRASSYPPAM